MLNAPVLLETTLDEPVWDTVKRDLRAIAIKLRYVVLPRINDQEDTMKELRNWDLWGPLLLCLTLSLVLSSTTTDAEQSSTLFSLVFVLIWGGASVVTVNCQLLGGKVSFFQSLCLLGYCVFPLVVASVLGLFSNNVVYRSITVGLGLFAATRASVVFISQLVPEDRQVLAAYPTLLFYSTLAWLVFTQGKLF